METVAAYAGGCVTGALCVQPPGSAFQYLLNVCIGITAVAAMPAAWLVPEPEEKPQAGQAQPQQYSAAATRLEQVSQSLASLAETVNDVYETLPHRREDFHWVIDNTHDTLCFNCGRRDTCWKQEYAATLEGMEALRPLLESSAGRSSACCAMMRRVGITVRRFCGLRPGIGCRICTLSADCAATGKD